MITIGFLPFFIKLYDDSSEGGRAPSRDRLEPFYNDMAKKMEEKGYKVVTNPFCRIKPEFEAAIKNFEEKNVDCIVTWHAAYSPSLEAIDAICNTKLPVVVCDTTETEEFSPIQDPAEISYCHGIHGVMDFCNMMTRRNKPYAIAAGHLYSSNVIDRVLEYVNASVAATTLNGSKIGLIGQSFPGMGDFITSDEELKARFGVEVIHASKEELVELKAQVTDEEIKKEIALDLANSKKLNDFSEEDHALTVKNCLAVRKWLENNKIDAFSVDFMDMDPDVLGLDIMPFMEACKAMERGIGYAGEGDTLTATLVGALMKGFDKTTFVEIFCPDWKNGTVLLSHMGEVNYKLTKKPIELKKFQFNYGNNAKDPIIGYSRYVAGKAVFANIYRDADHFKLLLAPVTMEEPSVTDNFEGNMRGWMNPGMGTAEFLQTISTHGVTHHSALIYDTDIEAVDFFGRLLGLEVVRL